MGCLLLPSASAADVKENWEKVCAKCHGPDGKGDTKMGQKLAIKDLTDAKLQAEGKPGCVVAIVADRGDRYFSPLRWEKKYVW